MTIRINQNKVAQIMNFDSKLRNKPHQHHDVSTLHQDHKDVYATHELTQIPTDVPHMARRQKNVQHSSQPGDGMLFGIMK